MLRYGAARAHALGVQNVQFIQADAADMKEFADGQFDWVQTTMFLHETGGKSIHTIFKEIGRVADPLDRKSTRLNSSHEWISRMPSSA